MPWADTLFGIPDMGKDEKNMEHGVFIEKGLSDWQIVQHINDKASITFEGSWHVIKDAVKIGVKDARPQIRVVSEEDNSQIIPWQEVTSFPADDYVTGTWKTTLTIPAGGLYRIETGLVVNSTNPQFKWTFRGDTRLHVGVGDVFLIAGQSNSAGYGKDAAFDPPQPGVHLYRNRHSWDLAAHPFNESSYAGDVANAERGVSGVSPYLAFGKAFRRLSHYPVGFIASAMGGMPIKRWNPDGGKLYQNMLQQTLACGRITGVLWYQGCSNTDEKGLVDYKEKFYDIINSFRRDLGYPVRFFTYQLNREANSVADEGYGTIREIQRIAAHELEDVYILPTIHCGLSDAIHNNAHSCIMLGENMAKLCGHVLYGTKEFFAPEIEQAVAKDDTVTATFQNTAASFVIPDNRYEACGFTLKDSLGTVPCDTIQADKNKIIIKATRSIQGDAFLSFAYEANPTRVPPLDEITYLPPLSFYEYPVTVA